MSQVKSEANLDLKSALSEFSQLSSTLILAISILCFVFGLLIVNIRLAHYGVYSTEFVRTEYVLVGATFILLNIVAEFSVWYGVKQYLIGVNKWKSKNKSGAVAYILSGVFANFVPISWLLNILSNFTFNASSGKFWWSILILISRSFFIGNLSTRFFKLLRKLSVSQLSISSEEDLKSVNDMLGVIPFILISIGSYTSYTYPYISAAMGGGKKDPVMLIATPRGTQVTHELGLPSLKNGALVGPIQLLTESENTIVVFPTDEKSNKYRAVKLNRDLFDAVITIPIENKSASTTVSKSDKKEPASNSHLKQLNSIEKNNKASDKIPSSKINLDTIHSM